MSKLINCGTSLDILWLGFCAPNARGTGSIPGWGTKIPHAPQWDLKEKNLTNFILSTCAIYCGYLCLNKTF